MQKDKRLIVLGYVFLIVVIVIVTLIWQAHRVEQEMKEIEQMAKIKPPEVKREKPVTTALIPDRPEDYGMVVLHEFDKPKTQAEWNEFMRKNLEELKQGTSSETLDKVRDKIKEDPAKTQEKIAKIDSRIQECKEILSTEPANEEVQARLERLMILRAIAEQMQDF